MTYQPYAVPPAPKRASGMATASLVLGLSGIALSWCTLAIPSILGLIFGFIGLKQTVDNQLEGKGMAIAGIVSSFVVLALTVVFWVAWGFTTLSLV